MGKVILHMMKIKAGAVAGIQSHNNREHEPKTNPDVDVSRSKNNYNLVACENYRRAIREKISDLVKSKKAVRKDAVVACNFIVTSDQQTMDAMGEERQRAFFEDSVRWFANRYGADRILNATVHMDETTPHLHIGIVPITHDGRLSAKAIFTKTELKAMQTEFARDVGTNYGLERGIEGSERTHLAETRFKAEKALQDAVEAHQRALQAQERVNSLEAQQRALEGEIKALQTKREVLTAAEVEATKGQKTLLGGLKGVTYKQFEAVKRTAAAVDSMTVERDQALVRAKQAELRATIAEEQAKQAYAERPSLKAQMEVTRLNKDNQVLHDKIAKLKNQKQRLLSIIRKELPEIYTVLTQPRTQGKSMPKSTDIEH